MSRSFDGTGDNVQVASNAKWNPATFSVSVWFYAATGASIAASDQIINAGGSGIGSGWNIGFWPDGNTLQITNWDGTPTITQIGNTAAYVKDAWNHVVLTSDNVAPSHSWYLSGAVQGAASTAARPAAARALVFGALASDPSLNCPQILIAETGFFNSVLTAGQIAMLAAGYSPLFLQAAGILTGYWPFNNGDSPELDWISGLHGTVNGAVLGVNPPIILPA